jgi:Phosphodiester glycosidase
VQQARVRLSVVALCCLGYVATLAFLTLGDGGPQDPDHEAPVAVRAAAERDPSRPPGQTSEGITGPTAPQIPLARRGRTVVSGERGWQVAPGVRYRRWNATNARGRIRAHLLTVNPSRAGVTLDYAHGRYVTNRAPLTRLLARDDAVAGINGGFFDIYDTGAPRGMGRDRQLGMLHASKYTYNDAFYMTRDGEFRIGPRILTARIEQFPQIEITNVNSPAVRPGKVGIYAPAWGRTYGYRVTDGQRKRVRMVVIQDGRVASNRTRLNSDLQIRGLVLIGRGPGADALSQLRVGSIADVDWALPGEPQVAISGDRILLRNGVRQVTNDRELHPRSAIGIDRDTGRLLLLVIDGRQSFSRGYTLVEEARMMKQLGAEDALNLDGGGSSTMVAENRDGRRQVLNSPSDGRQRAIPDGIAIMYDAP